MALDEQLRAQFRQLPKPSVSIDESLASVKARGQRRRRVRTAAIPMATATAIALVAVVLSFRSDPQSLDTLTPPPAPPAAGTSLIDPSTTEPANTPTPPTTATTTVTSTTTPTNAVPVDLTFTGVVAGHVTTATVAPAGIVLGPHDGQATDPVCTPSHPDPEPGATFAVQGTLADKPFLLAYSVGDIHNVNAGLAEGIAIIGHDTLNYNAAYWYDPTNVIVDTDRLGGQIDTDLHNSTGVIGHVSGHFRCAP